MYYVVVPRPFSYSCFYSAANVILDERLLEHILFEQYHNIRAT